MSTYEFEKVAKIAVIDVIHQKYGETYVIEEINVVWMVHLLGYKKAILIDGGENQRVYEVTYNRDKEEMYVDAYEKASNSVYHI